MIVVAVAVGVLLFVVVPVRIGQAMASFDHDPFDDLDVYCPLCDGTDLDDWGEADWWSCRPCAYLFEMKESV